MVLLRNQGTCQSQDKNGYFDFIHKIKYFILQVFFFFFDTDATLQHERKNAYDLTKKKVGCCILLEFEMWLKSRVKAMCVSSVICNLHSKSHPKKHYSIRYVSRIKWWFKIEFQIYFSVSSWNCIIFQWILQHISMAIYHIRIHRNFCFTIIFSHYK